MAQSILIPELPRFVPPMLAKRGAPFDSQEHLFELKWDGTRALAFVDSHGYRLVNRHRADVTDRYPELGFLLDLPAGVVLDGEVVVLRQGQAGLRVAPFPQPGPSLAQDSVPGSDVPGHLHRLRPHLPPVRVATSVAPVGATATAGDGGAGLRQPPAGVFGGLGFGFEIRPFWVNSLSESLFPKSSRFSRENSRNFTSQLDSLNCKARHPVQELSFRSPKKVKTSLALSF